MIHTNVRAIVLAAGKSTRLKTGRNKLLEELCGQPMILFSTKTLGALAIPTTVVVGHEAEALKTCIQEAHQDTVTFALQSSQEGTGSALRCTRSFWDKEHILVINGDMPLITTEVIEALYEKHIADNASVSFVMSHHIEPNSGYGRVVQKDNHIKIVEAKEFDGDTNEYCCVNAGIYLINTSFLKETIDTIAQNETTHEFHITDLIAIASEQQRTVATINAPFDVIRGVNNQHELWAAEQIKRSELIKYWMERGVRFSVAHNVHIDLDVTIGTGTYIGCGVHLLYGTTIGQNCKIHEYTSLEYAHVGDNTQVYPFSIISHASVGSDASVGPFAHIKEGTSLGDRTAVGNFVEVKNSTFGAGSKAKHLSYLGDATLGNNVNVGAGTITCNFDGNKKHRTEIEDNAFVGSNNTLVAPLHIGQGAFTAAGSTINKDVPADALAVGRARQENKEGYAKRLLKKDIQPARLEQQNKPAAQETCASETCKEKKTFMGAVRTTNDTIIDEHR